MIGDILILAEAYEAACRYLLCALKYARQAGGLDIQHQICSRLARLRALRASGGPKLTNVTGNPATRR